MNHLLLYPLLMLVFIAGFCQLLQFSTKSSIDLSYNNTNKVNPQTGSQISNGSQTNIQVGNDATNAVFDINMIGGFIAIIVAIVAVGVVAGIRVLGSGLSEYSVQLIHKSALYYGLWGIFSGLSLVAFSSIPLMGLFAWLIMTILYSFGFFQTLQTSGGGQ